MEQGATSRRTFLASVASATTAVAGCLDGGGVAEPELYATPAAEAFEAVVDVNWLEANLEDVRLLDVRAEDRFAEGHIEGAHRFPDVEQLTDQYEETEDGPRASLEPIAAVLADAGIDRDDDVVVYGAGTSQLETYGIFTVRAIGHEGTVSLLDGGVSAWEDADGPTETGPVAPEDGTYRPELERAVLATRASVAECVDEAGVDCHLVDSRTPEEYAGLDDYDDRFERHGHVTGAINVDHTQNVTDDGRRLRSPETLEQLWQIEAGLDPDEPAITYCVSGIRGSVAWFVLDQLGWADVRNYEGGWLDWGTLSTDDGYEYTAGERTGTVVDPFD